MEPVWEAVRFEAVLKTGRTCPILLGCQHQSKGGTKRERFVTKALGLPEVHDFTLCHEFIGASLAKLVGLAAPRPVLVNLSEEFLAVAEPDLQREGVRPSAGIGVGSTFVPHLQPFPASAKLAETEFIDAARVYVFDLLVQNADRRGYKSKLWPRRWTGRALRFRERVRIQVRADKTRAVASLGTEIRGATSIP